MTLTLITSLSLSVCLSLFLSLNTLLHCRSVISCNYLVCRLSLCADVWQHCFAEVHQRSQQWNDCDGNDLRRGRGDGISKSNNSGWKSGRLDDERSQWNEENESTHHKGSRLLLLLLWYHQVHPLLGPSIGLFLTITVQGAKHMRGMVMPCIVADISWQCKSCVLGRK